MELLKLYVEYCFLIYTYIYIYIIIHENKN